MKEIEFIKEYHLLERIESQSIFFSKHNDRQKRILHYLCSRHVTFVNNIIEAYEDIRHRHAA